MDKRIYLTLENGKTFEGYSFGAEKEVVGELVFTTGMTGYVETLTDPCYYGQIVAHTFPLIGNYGMIGEDMVGKKSALTAYVVREKCDAPSNFRCTGTLEDYLKREGIPAIYGVDTRELTRIIREAGVMNASLTFKPVTDFAALKNYKIENAVKAVACGESKTYGEGKYKVALYDFGATDEIVKELLARDCQVITLPATATADEALAVGANGVVLSCGAGDPAENVEAIENIKKLIGKLPVFGVGLGHQLFALAVGGKTRKMKYGHRGANQPVKEVATGKVFISAQNHGFEVVADSLPTGTVNYINVNDGSCEGVDYAELCAFTVQFHPASYGGPHDANCLFDKFIENMKKEK